MIITILEHQTFKHTVWVVFTLNAIFMACSVIYLSYYVLNEPQGIGSFQSFLRVMVHLLSVLLLAIEYGSLVNGQQFGNKRLAERVINFLAISNIIMTNTLIVLHGNFYELERQSALADAASVNIVLQWFMLIWWLRIFKRLSIYVILIYQTISEIIEFFFIFILCILMFGNAVFVLN